MSFQNVLEKLSVHAIRIHENPDLNGSEGMNHYQVRIGHGDKKFVTFFSMGLAHKNPPTLADVLPCLALDCRMAEGSFEDFCSDAGYDSDSRQAERIYNSCIATRKKMRAFFGVHFSDFLNIEE